MFEMDPDKIPYERKYLNETITLMEQMLSNVDSKIKKAQAKLEDPVIVERPRELIDKLSSIDSQIKTLLNQVERLGDEGRIDESERLCLEIEQYKAKKEELLKITEPTISMNKMMKVCEICGALQSVTDTEKRQQTHLEGKQHVGYAKLKQEVSALKARREVIRMQETIHNRDKKEKQREYSPQTTSRQSVQNDRFKPGKKSRSRSNSWKKQSYSKKQRSNSRSRSREYKKNKEHKSYRDYKESHSKEHKSYKGDQRDHHKSKRV